MQRRHLFPGQNHSPGAATNKGANGLNNPEAGVASLPVLEDEDESDQGMLEKHVLIIIIFFSLGKCFAVLELLLSGMVCSWLLGTHPMCI